MCNIVVELPEIIIKRVKELGADIESKVVELLLQELKFDSGEEIEVRIELAERLLKDGTELVDRDPVQSSEKLYKAAEECVKALAIHFRLEDMLKKVKERGRWTVMELEKAVEAISDRMGEWLYDAWDHAWTLHVWGFHEAKLDSEAVKRRQPHIAKIVEGTKSIIGRTNEDSN